MDKEEIVMPRGVSLTPEEQQRRRVEIAGAALRIFREKGYARTSMREIAKNAGMGKSSLYDYFTTKDDIVAFALEEEISGITPRMKAIASEEIPPYDRLRKIMELDLRFMQDNNSLILWLNLEAQSLSRENQTRIREIRYGYQDVVRSVIEEGIAKGVFRKVDPLLAARLLINSLLSVLYTTRPTATAEDMLHEAVDIFLDGVREK